MPFRPESLAVSPLVGLYLQTDNLWESDAITYPLVCRLRPNSIGLKHQLYICNHLTKSWSTSLGFILLASMCSYHTTLLTALPFIRVDFILVFRTKLHHISGNSESQSNPNSSLPSVFRSSIIQKYPRTSAKPSRFIIHPHLCQLKWITTSRWVPSSSIGLTAILTSSHRALPKPRRLSPWSKPTSLPSKRGTSFRSSNAPDFASGSAAILVVLRVMPMALGSFLASRLVRNATTSRVRLAAVNSHRNSKLSGHSSSFIYLYWKLIIIPELYANGTSHS